MFDIHHFGFCSSDCLFFDADRLFRQQNTQPMIETPTGTNTTKVPFLGDSRATTAAWQSKKYRQQS
jgi:hypothetical protein